MLSQLFTSHCDDLYHMWVAISVAELVSRECTSSLKRKHLSQLEFDGSMGNCLSQTRLKMSFVARMRRHVEIYISFTRAKFIETTNLSVATLYIVTFIIVLQTRVSMHA